MNPIDHLMQNGYCVIEKSLSAKKITELLDVVENIIADTGVHECAPPVGTQKSIETDPVINNIHYHSSDFLDLVVNGEQIEPIKTLLNDPYYGLIPQSEPNFILAQCNLRKSTSVLDYHIDVRLKMPFPTGWSIQCIVALEDRNRRNGGLKVIPGSHLMDQIVTGDLDTSCEQFVDLKAGDMVIFWSHLYHGTTACALDEKAAWGLLLTYRAWWCKPQFDYVKMFDHERFANLSQRTKTLLGFYSQPSSVWNDSPSARQGYSI
jgi:ectoine hydroxylase-related dioxygenase (phytanoyl-CoA dioxygenase family)